MSLCLATDMNSIRLAGEFFSIPSFWVAFYILIHQWLGIERQTGKIVFRRFLNSPVMSFV
jgi:hypothetical protein